VLTRRSSLERGPPAGIQLSSWRWTGPSLRGNIERTF